MILVWMLLLHLINAPLFAEASPDLLQLGPARFTRLPDGWQRHSEEEINFRGFLENPGKKASIEVVLEPVTAYERRWDPQAMIQTIHQQWRNHMKSEGFLMSPVREESLKEGTLSYVETAERGGEIFEMHRFYIYDPEIEMAVIGTFKNRAADARTVSDFLEMMKSCEIDSSRYFSPCVRLGLIRKKFFRLAQSAKTQNEVESLNAFKKSLEAEIQGMLDQHPHHHPAAHYYMLGYLASFNDGGEYLGRGFKKEEAEAYYLKAHELDPDSNDPLHALSELSKGTPEGILMDNGARPQQSSGAWPQ